MKTVFTALALAASLTATALAQSPYPDSTLSSGPSLWEKSSIASQMETAQRDAESLRARADALEKEAAALLAENNRLKDEIASANALGNLTKAGPNDPEVVKIFRQRYSQLLTQHRAVTEQLANLQIENRRLEAALKAGQVNASEAKARADTAELALRSGKEDEGRLREEAMQARAEATKSAARVARAEAEANSLREDKRVLEALVRRLDPDRVAKLEQGIRERDALLKEAAQKLAAQK